ncbi:hypothetical protein JB92DRAFT_3013407 [Gautieria morchelliformis]|nr:hypothetical protein JB92DRAFT_3013407 [Gautieria morchelliformis]
MGFFSSRKAEPTPLPASEATSSKAIRSRFYDKNKRISARSSYSPPAPPPLPSLPVCREAAVFNQSPETPGRQASADALTMSLAQRLNELAVANADNLLNDEEYRLLRQNLFERFSAGSDMPTEAPVVPISPVVRTRDSHHRVTRRPSADSQRSIATTMSSLFRRATGRSRSPASPNLSRSGSVGGSVSSHQHSIRSPHDATSVHSRPSFSYKTPRSPGYSRSISRQTSDDSLMSTSQAGSTSASVTHDMRSVMTRHRIFGGNSGNYASSISSRTTTRSAKPPSSFHLRQPVSFPRIPPRTHEDDDDNEHPKSAAELREEIGNVECEGRKLLDAFNGLELTALTKSQAVGSVNALLDASPNARRLSIYSESMTFSTAGSSNTLVPERATSMRKQAHGKIHAVPLVAQPVNLKRKPSVVNSITGSFKSSTSDLRSGFMSVPPSLYNSRSARSSPNLLPSALPPPPPVPALPISALNPSPSLLKKRPSLMRQQRQTTPSTISPSRGRHTPPPIHVSRLAPPSKRPSATTDPVLRAVEAELADIRRRKADVSMRYERRLDFLRAKLKSAEIRERLIKK